MNQVAKVERVSGPTAKTPNEKALLKEVKDAAKEVERIRKERVGIRDTAPRGKMRAELAKTDDAFVEAINRQNEAERALGRFRRTDEHTQHATIGTASEGERAN